MNDLSGKNRDSICKTFFIQKSLVFHVSASNFFINIRQEKAFREPDIVL